MSVYVCEFCGKLLHCDLGILKKDKSCPFEPCFSAKCFEMMRRFGDRVELCCDSCYEKFQLIKKGIMNPAVLKRALMCMDDRVRLSASMVAEKMSLVAVVDNWRKEEFFMQTRIQNRLHEARTRNALRRKAPTSTFWQRR